MKDESENNGTPFFILSEMADDDGNYKFSNDVVLPSFTDCVNEVKKRIDAKISETFSKDELEDVFVPEEEDIYKSLYEDKYVCYVLGDGTPEYRMVFHISKIIMSNQIKNGTLDFCEK